MLNNITPSYLSDLVPDTIFNRHEHNTRQSNNLVNIFTRTNLYSEYFLSSTIKLWNNLDINIRSSDSIATFKRFIQTTNDKTPVYYYVGTRIGQILHSRLRMNCSSLNSHLFFKNLVTSPTCSCGAIETTSHYLLYCPKYQITRNELLDSQWYTN